MKPQEYIKRFNTEAVNNKAVVREWYAEAVDRYFEARNEAIKASVSKMEVLSHLTEDENYIYAKNNEVRDAIANSLLIATGTQERVLTANANLSIAEKELDMVNKLVEIYEAK